MLINQIKLIRNSRNMKLAVIFSIAFGRETRTNQDCKLHFSILINIYISTERTFNSDRNHRVKHRVCRQQSCERHHGISTQGSF